jgi:hypothetical protein
LSGTGCNFDRLKPHEFLSLLCSVIACGAHDDGGVNGRN